MSCQISKDSITQKKTISLQGLAKTSFYPDPFQMSLDDELPFACLRKHSYKDISLASYLFFSCDAHILLCLIFSLFLPRHLFINTWNQLSASVPLHLTRQQRHLLLAYIQAQEPNQLRAQHAWAPEVKHLKEWFTPSSVVLNHTSPTQVQNAWKLGYFSPLQPPFPTWPRHREVCICLALLFLLIVLASITLSKAIAEIKLLNWIHMLTFTHRGLIRFWA